MNLLIQPPTYHLKGSITPPGSKSYSHRAFILAALAKGLSIIKNPLTSGDVSITMKVLRKLGIKIEKQEKNVYKVHGREALQNKFHNNIDCGNSGTSIRIFSALSLLIDGGLKLRGEFFRRERPLSPLLKALKELGAAFSLSEQGLSIHRERSICNNLEIRGDISSQFITALLIIGSIIPCPDKQSIKIKLTTPVVSYPYLKITLNILDSFGIHVQEHNNERNRLEYIIKTGQVIHSRTYDVPSDFSSAAFIIAAATLTPNDSRVIVNNLDFEDPQGDKRIINILKKMGADIRKDIKNKRVICHGNLKENSLNGLEIDCKNIPDLFPILSVVGAYAKGKTVLSNAENLRLKESDRISIMARELTKMGVKVVEEPDKLIIHHCNNIKGANIDHNGDHRVAMACSIAALYATSNSHVQNIEVVKDSYPEFVEDLKKLGATTLKVK